MNQHSIQHPALAELAEVTAPMEFSGMQISPSQASFMTWLLRLNGAKRCIEVGVFTGYSALVTALALPEDGYLLACDISEEWTSIGKKFWKQAGVEKKIDLVLKPAAETLQQRIDMGDSGSFDFAFIDADKEGYLEYFELCLPLLRSGGVIAFDNALWGGSVADESKVDASTCALRELNSKLISDPRVVCSLVPIGDGLLLVTKN